MERWLCVGGAPHPGRLGRGATMLQCLWGLGWCRAIGRGNLGLLAGRRSFDHKGLRLLCGRWRQDRISQTTSIPRARRIGESGIIIEATPRNHQFFHIDAFSAGQPLGPIDVDFRGCGRVGCGSVDCGRSVCWRKPGPDQNRRSESQCATNQAQHREPLAYLAAAPLYPCLIDYSTREAGRQRRLGEIFKLGPWLVFKFHRATFPAAEFGAAARGRGTDATSRRRCRSPLFSPTLCGCAAAPVTASAAGAAMD